MWPGHDPARWKVIALLTVIDRDHGLRGGLSGYLGRELVPPPSRGRAFVAAIRAAGGAAAPPDLRGDRRELQDRLVRHQRVSWAVPVRLLSRAG
jgi:hypothetical protein